MISLESERSILVGGGQAKGTEEVPAIEITFNVDPPPYNPEGPDPRRSGGTFPPPVDDQSGNQPHIGI